MSYNVPISEQKKRNIRLTETVSCLSVFDHFVELALKGLSYLSRFPGFLDDVSLCSRSGPQFYFSSLLGFLLGRCMCEELGK